MNRHAVQLIALQGSIEWEICFMTMGTVFGWPDMGTVGKTVLGFIRFLNTSILVNPIWWRNSDRFSRRKILMTTDLVCGLFV